MSKNKKSDIIITLDEEISNVLNELNKQFMDVVRSIGMMQKNITSNREDLTLTNKSISDLSKALLLLNNRILEIEKYLGLGNVTPPNNPNDSNLN